jgi:hypothetical protein
MKTHAHYWRERFAGVPPTRVPVGNSLAGHHYYPLWEIPFGNSLSEELRMTARRERTLLALVVLAVYAAAMSRWCGRSDLVIKLIAHGRNRPELHSIVGFLANALYLRIAVSEEDSLVALLDRIHRELRSAYEHDDMGRMAMLMPECITELTFNWAAQSVLRSAVADAAATVRVQPLQWDVPAAMPYFAQFSDSPEIVAQVYSRTDGSALTELQKFSELLMLFARGFAGSSTQAIKAIR